MKRAICISGRTGANCVMSPADCQSAHYGCFAVLSFAFTPSNVIDFEFHSEERVSAWDSSSPQIASYICIPALCVSFPFRRLGNAVSIIHGLAVMVLPPSKRKKIVAVRCFLH